MFIVYMCVMILRICILASTVDCISSVHTLF